MNTNFFVSECIKMKRSGFYSIVLGTPVITGLCYIFYCFCSKDFATDAFYYYILTLSIISPCILSFSLYIPFNIERKCCNGKELFSNQYGLKKAITEKICFVFISYLSSLIISLILANVSFYAVDATYITSGCFVQGILLADFEFFLQRKGELLNGTN